MHKITILWGESPEDGQEAVTYRFATAAELKAFCLGVDAMDGYFGYEEVEEGFVYREEDADAYY